MSCNTEKLSIPLEAHHKAQLSEIFLSSLAKNKIAVIFFYLWANHAETAYLSFRDWELSNDVWLVQLRRRKVVVHTFLWVVTGHCLRAGIMESHNFFVLRPIWVKFHSRTRLIESFSTTFCPWWCGKEKLHFTPVHISTQPIDSFSTTYGPRSCDKEKLSMSLEAHHTAQSSEIFLSFPAKI